MACGSSGTSNARLFGIRSGIGELETAVRGCVRFEDKRNRMQIWKLVSGMTVAAGLLATTAQAPAQVAVEIGAQPDCPYGYYEAPPYQCAPDGYYGPEWYTGGVFIGAGPWFHGGDHFYGHVDHRLDYRKGYKGNFPARGEHPAAQRAQFHGQAMHDAHGHEAPHGHR
jgi:hypothetical protein